MAVGSFVWWTRPVSAELFDLRAISDLRTLRERYAGINPVVFDEVLGHAYDLGGRSVVAEYRYLDADYRNEHSQFYSTTFRRYPSVAHRLHFFTEQLSSEVLDAREPSSFPNDSYLGYSVIRPVSAGSVGRTMLLPGDDLAKYVSCKARDTTNLFGTELTVTAAPFMTQESQLGVCVHVTAWVCAYYHHKGLGAPRYLPGDIAAGAPSKLGRMVPAIAMSVEQLSAMLESIELPPVVYDLRDLQQGESLFMIACRYLNSGLPVVVAGGRHAFVLVGYRRIAQPEGQHARIEFIRQDDQHGPYQIVENPFLDDWRPWQYLVIPLPRKVYVSGERAETVGRERLKQALRDSATDEAADLLDRIDKDEVVFRSAVVRSNQFKARLASRHAPQDVVAAYQWGQMSRWVWVVEAIDHDAWDAGEPSVCAEVLIDATDHSGDPRPIAWRLPDRVIISDPDNDTASPRLVAAAPKLKTVCQVDAALCNAAT